MPRANTRSLLSDVDMEDTGGLLARQRNAGQQAPSSLPAVEVTPYYEIVGQTEQDAGTPQLMGQVISTPLGGTMYRSDVMDLNGNLLRSNVHDAGADKYGLGDMAKLAAVALGANTLPGLMGAEGSLTAGVTPQSVAAAEAALPTALSSAPLSTALATPLAELGTVAGLSEAAVSALPTLAASAPAVLAPSMLSSAPLSTTLAAPAAELVAPSAISGGGMTAGGLLTGTGAPAILSEAAVSALPVMPTATVAEAFRPSQNYGEGMTGAQTSAYDGVINATGSPALANAAANVAGAGSNVVDFLKANPALGQLLFSGAGALLSATGGGGGSGGGGYVDSGYRPTISRGGFNAAPQARQMAPTMGLLTTPTTGQPMSGLWRYGLLGG